MFIAIFSSIFPETAVKGTSKRGIILYVSPERCNEDIVDFHVNHAIWIIGF